MKNIEEKRRSQGKAPAIPWPLHPGKRSRLFRLFYGAGPRNGTLMILPLDQGFEHGPTDFLPNPGALDTNFQFRLAIEGRYSAIALGVGLAEKYLGDYAGRVPLILKLNGKTNIPRDDSPVSPLFGSVQDAVRLGADAVGYTFYVGSPRQEYEILQFQKVREDCERFGMPIMLWSYPRGQAVEAKGGKGSLFATDYAARLAEELGADIVKLHEPQETNDRSPEPYRRLREGLPERLRRVVRSAGRCHVVFSGGPREDDRTLLRKTGIYLRAGAAGVVFGRNLWQRPYSEAVALSGRLHRVLARHAR